MAHDLEKLSTIPNSNSGWLLPVLQTASHYRVQARESSATPHIEGAADGQILEEMLDEERIPVEV